MDGDGLKKDVDRIDDEFMGYRQSSVSLVEPIRQGMELSVADVIERLDDYWLFLSMIADKKVFNGMSKGSMYLVAKCSTDILGISACLKSGLPAQGFTLLRSLWETTVTTKYICQDFDVRMNDFIQYADVDRYKKLKRHPESVPENRADGAKSAFQHAKHRFKWRDGWYYPSMREEGAARGLSLQEAELNMHTMAKFAGMEKEYETMYGTLSKVTHGSSVIEHLFRKDGHFQGGLRFDRELSTSIVGLAIHCGDVLVGSVLSMINTNEAMALRQYSQFLYSRFLKTYVPKNSAKQKNGKQ